MLRLMVVDDEPPARRGLKRLMQAHEDVDVVGEAGSLDQAQELTHALRPDAIFLDIDLGGDRGIQHEGSEITRYARLFEIAMMPLGECDYQLTIAYDTDPDGSSLDDEINHPQTELFNVAESYRCSVEADIREVGGQQRSW